MPVVPVIATEPKTVLPLISALEAAVDQVLADNPQQVEGYRGGRVQLLGFFVGQIMKKTQGKANPGLVNELLKKRLEGQG